ncbi:D-alanyl-D-alanine carboxypeptidase [Cellulomonas septica]|uniref:DNA ligase (ATP) n=1 Tax=Cellulomonas septica TaxID=285080 RepID=A0ABX1K4W5_9CELL|nr:D-alanyl-D-alanine carboxypeptidase [Cellulomonas septica]NKY40610.1 hypothetical protein [Cellulomonas septica]
MATAGRVVGTAVLVVVLAGAAYGTADAYDVAPGLVTLEPSPAPAAPFPTAPGAVDPGDPAAVLGPLDDQAPVPGATGVQGLVDGLVADPRLGPSVGVVVADQLTGEVLASHLPDQGRTPASTAKLVTAVAALDALGATGVPRLVTTDAAAAQDWFASVVAAGQEGVVVKAAQAPYEAGRRGAAWVKVKPRHTLDLVVLAVERGSGRRQGLLSNIHLGARDGHGGFVMLGKTFKGMTDETLAWQTQRFRELEVADDGWTVTVRPEQVVEIAFDGVQRSTRYPGGVALRFARVLRYRDDKPAAGADTIDAVRALTTGS